MNLKNADDEQNFVCTYSTVRDENSATAGIYVETLGSAKVHTVCTVCTRVVCVPPMDLLQQTSATLHCVF